MYDKKDKRRLYWLINQYSLGNIDELSFCDEFYYSYDLEIDYSSLTDIEKVSFDELSHVASRFSEYEEDHRIDAKVFSSVEELRQKILETKNKLESGGLL